MESILQTNIFWASVGIFAATVLAGIGSAIGVGRAGQAAAGVVAEEPEKFGSVMLLQLLPGSQGIYGLIISFLILTNSGIMGGASEAMQGLAGTGMRYLIAALPVAFGGLVSAIFQAKVSVSSIALVAKRGDGFGNGMLLTLMVEIYALFAFLMSLLMVINI